MISVRLGIYNFRYWRDAFEFGLSFLVNTNLATIQFGVLFCSLAKYT